MNHEEYMEQKELCGWMDERGIKYFAIANGGAVSPKTGKMLKEMGLKKGVPDLFVCVPSGYDCGLFIELKKKKGGRLSEEQSRWLKDLKILGYEAVCCNGADAAKQAIGEYFRWELGKENT